MAFLGGPQGLPPWDAQPIRIADPPPGGIPRWWYGISRPRRAAS
jgi:hypothetical protein